MFIRTAIGFLMKKIFKILIAVLILVAIVAVATIYIRSNIIDVLEPKGMVALKERDIIITSSLLMLIIVVPTLFLAFIFAWRYNLFVYFFKNY